MKFAKNSKRRMNSILCGLIIVVLMVGNTPFLSNADQKLQSIEPGSPEAESADMQDIKTDNISVEPNGNIEGQILVPKTMGDVAVFLYAKDDYDPKKEDYDPDKKNNKLEKEDRNIPIDKIKIDKDGRFQFMDLEPNSYHIDFKTFDKNFDAHLYEVDEESIKIQPEDAKVEYATDKTYFVSTEFTMKESARIFFKVREVEDRTDLDTKDRITDTAVDVGKVEPSPKQPTGASFEDPFIESSKEDPFMENSKIENIRNSEEENPISSNFTDINSQEKADQIIDEIRKETTPSIKELEENEDDEVGATTQKDGFLKSLGISILNMISGSDWIYDVYYVGESDKNYTEKTGDFSLKYQMEFHASRTLSAGAVKIQIPASLGKDRDGNELHPSEIAVPMATPGNYVETPTSPFNYYYDDSGNLIFFNYKEIKSGANAAWQILYKNMPAMNIKDETEWSIKADVTVNIIENGNSKAETASPEPLRGKLNTGVNLSVVSGIPNSLTGKGYGPGLYTKSQVKEFVKELPREYENNFDDYVYVLWTLNIKGNATQPWNLKIKDTTDNNGRVIGISGIDGITEMNHDGYFALAEYDRSKIINYADTGILSRKQIDIVTAYPKSEVEEGTVLKNSVDIALEPYDNIDPIQNKTDSATWGYKNYVWVYGPGIVAIKKYTPDKGSQSDQMKGWLSVYEGYKDNKEDKGDLEYTSYSYLKSYELTHYTSGPSIGKRIPGTSTEAITVDDTLYAHSSKDADNLVKLTDEDYYFNTVDIQLTDKGYDVYEDDFAEPEKSGDAEIYVMYRDSSDWTHVKTIPWNDSGQLEYTLTKEDLSDQPYRVKVEHKTINYTTECKIGVKVSIRHGSPVFANMMKDENASIAVQNLSGILAKYYKDGNFVHNIQSNEPFNYEKYPISLQADTNDLYKDLIQRDASQVEVSKLNGVSSSYKTATVRNDANNGRANVRYNITASDGYEIYSKDGADDIQTYREDIVNPGKNEVMFYDLLPYGVQYDPTQPLVAGRTIDMNLQDQIDNYTTNHKLWDKTQVNVMVDDITLNHKGTGRTLVAFKVEYEGVDSSFYEKNLWVEGWGVSFGAYYDWKNMDIVKREPNIAAFMPARNDNRPLPATPPGPYHDDGTTPDDSIYGDLGEDIDGDNDTREKNVLYADATNNEDIAIGSHSVIEKLVKADSDIYAPFGKASAVGDTAGYTYDITVYNPTDRLKNIVIFDRLENAGKDRADQEPGKFDSDWWHGTFNGLQLKALDDLGIDYKVYYSVDRDAPLPEDKDPKEVLKAPWIEESEFEGEKSDVKAIAVDISKKKDGEDFVLEALDTVNIRVNMTSPESESPTWAYNNASYYSESLGTGTSALVVSDSTKVRLNGVVDLEIIKKIPENTPNAVRNNKFEFLLTRDGELLPNMEYTLYEKDGDDWKKVENKLYSTDANGKFSITADQKVVFENLVLSDDLDVKEVGNPFWKVEVNKESDNKTITYTFTNTYQPLLYVQKKLQNVPEGVNVSDEEFTFKLEADGHPIADKLFYYVDSVRTDGGIPSIIQTGNPPKDKTGITASDGTFKIKAGEIIALLPGDVGVEYTLSEVGGLGENDSWFCEKDSVTGILEVKGSSETINNYYKYKNLLLTKQITNQDPEFCTQEFTFQVADLDNNPIIGNEWVVLDSDGTETSTKGVLDNEGKFTVALAGKTVKIKKLIAGKQYIIKETESGTLYEAVNDGIVEVEMPKYGDNKEVTITNDYLKRPLSVTKHVLYDFDKVGEAEKVANKDFIMTISLGGMLLGNTDYMLSENGKDIGLRTTDSDGEFVLRHGQTATFPELEVGADFEVIETEDSDYGQIYPEDKESHKGTISRDKNHVTFINGKSGSLVLEKLYDGEGTKVNDMLQEAQNPLDPNNDIRKDLMVSFSLELTSANQTYSYPKQDTSVIVIDSITGTSDTAIWYKDQPLKIEPWKKVIINDLNKTDSYRLTESNDDQARIYTYNKTQMQIIQTDPKDNQAVTGTVESKPMATITNSISEIMSEGTKIFKLMMPGSLPVPEGSTLVWRIEEYRDGRWIPKTGVPYLSFDDNGVTCDEIIRTGSDGIITLTKTPYGLPYVEFLEDNVLINPSHIRDGTIRAIELISESDEGWGELVGYKNDTRFGLEIENAHTFVNSNLYTTVEVAKVIDEPSDAQFTFILSQITKTKNNPVQNGIKDESEILETVVRGGIPYTIYDQQTNGQVGSGVTTAAGEILIRGGQYARINLPHGTYWTLSEKILIPYELVDLNVTGDMIHKLNPNLAVVVPTVKLDAKPITLSKTMVNQGVINAETLGYVNLISAYIPKYILYDKDNTGTQELYVITAIGDSAFEGSGVSGNLIIPDTVTSIEAGAFKSCSGLSGDLRIPDSVTEIGKEAFWLCSGLSGNLTIGSNVQTIGESAFERCHSLTGNLIIPDKVTEIKANAFFDCDELGPHAGIGSGILSIADNAFGGESSIDKFHLKVSSSQKPAGNWNLGKDIEYDWNGDESEW